MKKILLMSCAFLALTAGLALAGPGGLNLGWSDCGGLPGSLNQTFACTSNSGSAHVLCASVVAPCCVTGASGMDVVIDAQSGGASLPLWWTMRATAPAGCRSAALSGNTIFPGTCNDYWQGQDTHAVSMDPPAGNRGRIKGLCGLPAGSPLIGPIPEGTETYVMNFSISNTKTVGTPNCAGCLEGVCLVLNQVNIAQPASEPGGQKSVTAPAQRNFCMWQSGIVGQDCYLATPSKNATWGSVKALYR